MPTRKVYTDLDMQSVNKITNLAPGVNPTDSVNFGQVQTMVEGFGPKDDVEVATQGNLNLAAPGTAIDGISLNPNDRVLVKAQTVLSENGIYVFNGALVPMTRSADANTFEELEGALTFAKQGTDAGRAFFQTQVGGTLGTNDIVWNQFGGGAVQATETTSGIMRIATQANTDAGTVDNEAVTPLKLKTSIFASRGYTALFGDGSATLFNITHNLNGHVVPLVLEEATGEYVNAKLTRISANVVRVEMTPAPAVNAFRVLVHRVGG